MNRKGALVSTDGHTIRHLIVRLKLALVAVNKECADPEPVAPPDGNQFAQLQLPPGLLAWGGTSQDGALSWLVTARGQPTKEQLLEAADHLATCASTL